MVVQRSVSSAFWRQKQAGFCEFKAKLIYRESAGSARVAQGVPVSKSKTKIPENENKTKLPDGSYL